MNSEDNYAWIDEHSRIHFVTTYSTYFAQDIATTPIEKFEPVDIPKNHRMVEADMPEERLLAYRSSGEFWGKQRAVVVTYNPATARKKNYTLESKLETMRQELLVMRTKVKEQAPHWRKQNAIQERYLRLCERLHISSELFTVQFHQGKDDLSMSFRKDPYNVSRKQAMFGKNIIITDNIDWTTREIVEASLDRWQVENRFRLSNNDDLVATRPIRHWTDSKIRCHLFSCVVALAYLRRLELKLAAAGIKRTAEDVMDDMRQFHSVLTLSKGARKPLRRLETPSKTQAEALKVFGHYVDDSGVLQALIR
jgi:transposase